MTVKEMIQADEHDVGSQDSTENIEYNGCPSNISKPRFVSFHNFPISCDTFLIVVYILFIGLEQSN